MNIKILHESKYRIAAVVEDDGETCPVLDFLADIDSQYQGSADGLMALIDRIAEHGFEGLSTKLCHYVDKGNKIYELIKGDLRLFFFKGHCDVIVIATHAIIKKQQKTANKDKNKAIEWKQRYQRAHDKKSIVFMEDED